MKLFNNLDELPDFKNAVLTIGSFDGVHTGHQKILDQVKQIAKEADGESVVITFHPHPRHFLFPDNNSPQLINTIDEKVALLKRNGIDNVVVVPFNMDFSSQSAEEYIENFLVQKFNPKYIVIGYDHKFGKNRSGNIELLKSYEEKSGFKIIEIDKQEIENIAVSSTKIRKALEAGEIRKANKYLDHSFSMAGTVVHGQSVGHSLGFPTANIEVNNKYKLIPPDGIYAVYAVYNEQRYKAMLYIGSRPTLKDHDNKTIEVNIFEFNKDIYGDKLKIELVEKIRGDARFDGLEALKARIAQDKVESLKILSDDSIVEKPLEAKEVDAAKSVAIVILNYNGEKFLREYLPSVVNSNYPNFKIHVADNGSTDESIAILEKEFPSVKVHDLKVNHGFAKGYNVALQLVEADILVLLNSDVEVTENWMNPIVEMMTADSTIGACQPKILDHKNKEQFEYAGAAGGWIDKYGFPFCKGRVFNTLEKDEGQYDAAEEIFWASGAAIFIRGNLFNQIGGFDEDYWAHHEEIDLCWRLKRAGYKVMSCPQSMVYHLGGGTLNYGNSKKTFLNFRNSLYSIHKNVPRNKIFRLIFARLLFDALAAGLFLLKGQFKNIGAIVKAHWTYFGNLSNLRIKRKQYKELINKVSIAQDANHAAIYQKSIVWSYYLKRKQTFKNLF